MTATRLNPSIEQVAYALAAEVYKRSAARYNAAFAALPTDISDDDYYTACVKIETELNHSQATCDRNTAAEALAAWAKARLETDAACIGLLAAHRESVVYMFANWRKYPKITEQFMDLCLRLENKPIPAWYTAYTPVYPPYATVAA